MVSVSISEEIKSRVPGVALACISCNVTVREEAPALWSEIDRSVASVAGSLRVEDISRLPAVAATRRAYKACGKDPARYRPSAEALLRRCIQGKGLYRVNNVVDLLNLVSISTGYSIGGYDEEQIEGDVVFGVGRADEPYEGIGRGVLNIASLPVFRDSRGAFGTPTSDSVRTSVTDATRRFMMVIIDFGISGGLETAAALAKDLLERHADARDLQIEIMN